MSITIRASQQDDYPVIADIYNEHILLNEATMDEHHYSAEDIQAWVDHFNNRERLYVAQDDQDVIGWGIIKRYSDRIGYRYAAETAIYLKEEYTGQGHGSTFKRYIIEEAKQLNYHHLVAKIFATNKRSIDYNLSLGYIIVGIQKEVGYKKGQWKDVCIMQLLLD